LATSGDYFETENAATGIKKKAYQVLIKKNEKKFYNRSNLSSYFIKKLLSYSDEIFRTNIRH
jgi:hypothetical protein